MHSPGNTPATAAGSATVRSALLELLGDVDALATRFVAQVREVVPYSDGAVEVDRLQSDAVDTYERVFRRLVDLPVPERLVEASRELGRTRAHLDVPLAAVTAGTRLHFRIVWEVLAERLAPEGLAAAVTLPVQVWQAVEEHSTDVQVGYHEAATALAYARERDRHRIVDTFLESDGRDGTLLSGAAAVLGMDVEADVVCAVVPAGVAVPGVGRRTGLHVHPWRGGAVLLATEDSALRDVVCGVGPLARGLARVPRAVRVAEAVAAVLPSGATGPVRPPDVALALAARALGPLRADVAGDVLSQVLALPAPERDRLLETFDVYCATGSVAATAERSFCHRNTVLNRLRRLGECTGLDVTVPAQNAVLLLAVTAWRAGPPDAGRAQSEASAARRWAATAS
ncbi:helix-turn-helix domain-containing protein [Kineococcus sp. NPDC059986]|uniref:helix-turn-helix domain-containing protein n=1 Tax=Kineococcus sp. NPDC059986 TaxID=3155538 RepID=UPI00344EB2B3